MGRTGFRVDWEVSPKDSLSLQGQVFKSNNHELVNEISGPPSFKQTVYSDLFSSGGFGMARWQHKISGTSDVSLGFYYDRYNRQETIVRETRDTLDFDFQHRFRVARRHQLLWGLEQRYTSDRTVGTAAAQLLPDHRGLNLTSAFVQDEVALVGDRLSLTLGSKFEHNEFTGLEVQPTARLLWMLRENQSAWAAVSRAVRTPSQGEEEGVFHFPAQPGPGGLPLLTTYRGDHGLQAENLVAYEAGYRVQVTRRLSVEAATFYNVYRDLVTSETGRPDVQFAPAPHVEVPILLRNGLRGETYGLEVDANWRPVERWRLSGSYTGLEVQLHAPPNSTNPNAEHGEGFSPHHQFSLASYLDVTRRVQFDTMIYRVGALPGPGVPAYTRCDVRVGWRPRESLEVSVGSQNLSGHKQVEYVSETFVHSTRVGRRVYGKVTWTF
jgi:iron complex outermembrane receptor protein